MGVAKKNVWVLFLVWNECGVCVYVSYMQYLHSPISKCGTCFAFQNQSHAVVKRISWLKMRMK